MSPLIPEYTGFGSDLLYILSKMCVFQFEAHIYSPLKVCSALCWPFYSGFNPLPHSIICTAFLFCQAGLLETCIALCSCFSPDFYHNSLLFTASLHSKRDLSFPYFTSPKHKLISIVRPPLTFATVFSTYKQLYNQSSSPPLNLCATLWTSKHHFKSIAS